MPLSPPFWRLTQPTRRVFTTKATLAAYLIIFLGIIATVTFTVLTKCYVVVCNDVRYLSNNPDIQDPIISKNCIPTTVYPGQTFSSPDSIFVYQALVLGNMTRPYPLEGCQIDRGSFISSLAFPSSTPSIQFNMSFICTSSHVSTGDKPASEYGGQPIYPNSIVLGIKMLRNYPLFTDDYYFTLRHLGSSLRSSNKRCVGAPMIGFEIHGPGATEEPNIAYMSDNNDSVPCRNDKNFDPFEESLFDFFNRTVTLANEDFKILSPLPNLVFTCPSCKRSLLPVGQFLWNILVAVAATWSIIYLVSTFMVGHMKTPYDSKYDDLYASPDEKSRLTE